MFSEKSLIPILQPFIATATFCVAYSGGMDSHVLLHSLASLRSTFPDLAIKAIHVNHGINPHAEVWSLHCLKVCQALSIPCTIPCIPKTAYEKAGNLEDCARFHRYRLLKNVLQKDEILLTAHHLDDQAETLLLRLFRGTAIKGLSAILFEKKLGKNRVLRPLLHVGRQSIAAYAKANELNWIEDPSNQSLQFDRNYLRHAILPLLKKRWPGLAKNLAHTATCCYEGQLQLTEMAALDYATVQGCLPQTISLQALRQLSSVRQTQVLLFWLAHIHALRPRKTQLQQLRTTVIPAKSDATPVVLCQSKEIRRFAGHLYCFPKLPLHDSEVSLSWDMKNPLILPAQIGTLVCKSTTTAEGLMLPEGALLTVRFRTSGEYFCPQNARGSKPLKKLLQLWRVPPWLRDRIPLIYYNKQLVMVTGFARARMQPHQTSRRSAQILIACIPGPGAHVLYHHTVETDAK